MIQQASSPEDEGLPGYADDTSYAEDTALKPVFNDSPASLPTDGPDYSDEYGVTPGEVGTSERLSARLERELPDRPARDTRGEQAGRLIWAGTGDPIGIDTGEHDGLSPEDAAIHIIDDTTEGEFE